MNSLLILGDTIAEGFYGIMLLLDGAIYSLIGSAYRIFMAVASARIMSSDAYRTVANNVYIIVGVVMLFVLAYAIIKSIIDPDEMTKGKLSGTQVLKRISIAVIGLALAPVVFNLLYQGQSLFIEKDVLSNLFFRSNNDCTDANGVQTINGSSVNAGEVCYNDEIKNVGGALTAASVWQAFFYPVDGDAEAIEADATDLYIKSAGYAVGGAVAAAGGVALLVGASNAWNPVGWVCLGVAAILGIASYAAADAGNDLNSITEGDTITLQDAYNISSATGNFYIFYAFLDDVVDDETINYIFIVSSIAGLFVLYVFICFSIDMGLRAARLAYYQIIAPIPLILQIIPTFNDQFKKYVTDVIKTFAEVFIRISVVYICIYMICHLTELFSSTEKLWGNQDLGSFETVLALAALILGIVTFAKTAPGMIGELFGLKAGDMKLGLRDKLSNGGLFTAGSIVGSQILGTTNSVANAVRSKGWKDKTFSQKAAMAAGAAARGFTRGTASSAYNTMRNPGPVKNGREMMDIARKSGNNAGDKEKTMQWNRNARNEANESYDNKMASLEADRRAGRISAAEYNKQTAEAAKERNATYWSTSRAYGPAQKARNTFFGTTDTKEDQELLTSYESGAKTKDNVRSAVNTKFNDIQRMIDNKVKEIETLDEAGVARVYDRLNGAGSYAALTTADQKEAAKRDAIAALEAERKTMNDVLESMRDVRWVEDLNAKNGKAMNAATKILGDAYTWKKNATMTVEVPVTFKPDGSVDQKATMTLGQFVTDYLGAGAIDGKLDTTEMAQAMARHDRIFATDSRGTSTEYRHVRIPDGVDANGKQKFRYEYALASDVDSSGALRTGGTSISEKDMQRILQNAKKVENVSAANIFSNVLRDNQGELRAYISEQAARKRQAEGGGGKK